MKGANHRMNSVTTYLFNLMDGGLEKSTPTKEQLVAYSECEIAWRYVAPDSMCQGVGKSLIMHVIENTIQRPLGLEALVGNNPALHLYEAMGSD
nr:GNAT family N-acetyltransferase [Clostridioides mangenotii]